MGAMCGVVGRTFEVSVELVHVDLLTHVPELLAYLFLDFCVCHCSGGVERGDDDDDDDEM